MFKIELRKVNCLSDILSKLLDNSLKTDSAFIEKYGLHPKMIFYFLKENWIVTGFLFLGSIIILVSKVLGYF
jgi:hypothetical protein